jgi:AsmA protein
MRRLWVKIVLAVVVLIVAVIVIVPFFVNGAALKPTVESKLSSAIGRRVTIGSLSFSLLAGSLVAKDIAVADDPAFSQSAFIRASELKVGVEVLPLLLHREINITNLVIDQPAIQLIQNQAGKWNFSSIGGSTQNQPSQAPKGEARPPAHPAAAAQQHAAAAQQPASPASPAAPPSLTVGELQIENGSASVSSVPPTAHPFVYSNVNLTVKNFSFTSSFPFDLSTTLPAKGTLKLSGTAGPIPETSADETPFQATLHIAGFDPVAAGLIEPSAGIAGVVDLDAKTHSNGTEVSSAGNIKAQRLQLTRTGSPSPETIAIDYNLSNDLRARTGRISDIAIHAGSAAAHVTGTYRFTPTAVVLDLHFAAPNMPIDPLEKLLPAFGIKLPTGSQLQGGTLSANLNITGPATATTIAGPVSIDNTNLAGFDVGSKIEGLNPFGAKNGGTEIKTLAATIDSAPQMTTISNINADLPQLGTATGSGTVSPSDALNFAVVATLSGSNASTAVGNLVNQGVNQARSLIGGFLHPGQTTQARTNKGIPLTITGTATSPRIRANLGALFK